MVLAAASSGKSMVKALARKQVQLLKKKLSFPYYKVDKIMFRALQTEIQTFEIKSNFASKIKLIYIF